MKKCDNTDNALLIAEGGAGNRRRCVNDRTDNTFLKAELTIVLNVNDNIWLKDETVQNPKMSLSMGGQNFFESRKVSAPKFCPELMIHHHKLIAVPNLKGTNINDVNENTLLKIAMVLNAVNYFIFVP